MSLASLQNYAVPQIPKSHNFQKISLPAKKQIKKIKLIRFAKSILSDERYRFELNRLLAELNLTREAVIQAYVDYNLDINSYGNEIYDSLATRFSLHMLNLLDGNWHQERQDTMMEFIQLCNPGSLVDMGFGEPSRYLKSALMNKSLKITLCDYSDSAFVFARALLEQWSSAWNEIISFKKTDMETGEYVGDFDVYVFQDSIEHVSKPTEYLTKYVKNSPQNANFIFSLPIGPIIPSHYIAWDTIKEATNWLSSCGLEILVKKQVYTNPEFDLFADQLGFDSHSFYVLCKKNV